MTLGAGAARLDSRQRFVSRHVVGDRQQDRPDEVQCAADEEVRGKAFAPREERPHRRGTASQGRSKERHHEGGGDRRHVDGLHGGDALLRWKAAQGLHNEGREGEEDPGHHRAAEGREEGQHKESAVHHPRRPDAPNGLPCQTPVAAVSRA